jgi:hypothetical protein
VGYGLIFASSRLFEIAADFRVITGFDYYISSVFRPLGMISIWFLYIESGCAITIREAPFALPEMPQEGVLLSTFSPRPNHAPMRTRATEKNSAFPTPDTK